MQVNDNKTQQKVDCSQCTTKATILKANTNEDTSFQISRTEAETGPTPKDAAKNSASDNI
ncbi:hypothetical protein Tcan_01910 [Toxocara canis]|uniref:Uncharacterized protein n=1 Tax=Toxocara canis TaxID=6265 RepID=A0A0B2VCJ2_TOXCA|nr:hypothetical protein Tcan_01910 [Toxocara canis]